MPWGDADGDGIPWYFDNEPNPFPPDHPFGDPDGDGVPSIYDVYPGGIDPIKPYYMAPNPNGIMDDSTTDKIFDSMREFMQVLGVLTEGDPFSWDGSGNLDSNHDGFVTPGEVLVDMSLDLQAEQAVLLSYFANPTIPDVDLNDTVVSWADKYSRIHSAVALVMPGSVEAALRLPVEEMLAHLEERFSELERSTDGETETTPVALLDGGSGEFLGAVDGSGMTKATLVDGRGSSVQPKGADNPLEDVSKTALTGDPVNTANGEFHYDVTDLTLEGRGLDLTLKRCYRSRSIHNGFLGHNWTMPLLETFIVSWGRANVLHVFWGDGTEGQLTREGTSLLWIGVGAEPTKAKFIPFDQTDCDTMTDGPGFVLRQPDGTQYYFCPPVWCPSQANGVVSWLRKVADPYGNAIVIKRHPWGGVREIVDSLGRIVQFTYEQKDAKQYLTTISAPSISTTISYTYDTDKEDLLRVDYPSELALDTGGALHAAAPREDYGYADHPLGWKNNKDWFLNHNLSAITRNGGTPSIEVSYYTTHGAALNDPLQAYLHDRVQSHTVDGKTFQYRYSAINPSGAADPYDETPHKITHQAESLSDSGAVERFYHGDGLLRRHEIVNGVYDTSWTLVGDVYASPDEPLVHDVWMDIYKYDDDQRLLSILKTTTQLFPSGRTVEYSFDPTTSDKYQQVNPITTLQRAYPCSIGQVPCPDVLTTAVAWDPVTSKIRQVTDSLGRVITNTFAHQELPYAQARLLPSVNGWDILPPSSIRYEPLFDLNDVNQDGTEGGSLELVRSEGPQTIVEAASGPGSPQTIRPTQLHKYTVLGLVSSSRDERGVWAELTRTYLSSQLTTKYKTTSGSLQQTIFGHIDNRGRLNSTIEADGSTRKFDYDRRMRPIAVRQQPAATGSGVTANDGSHPPPIVPSQYTDPDGLEIVVQQFYDLEDRLVGTTAPRYIPVDSGTGYSAGATPQLDTATVYDHSGNAISVTRRVYSPEGVLATEAVSEMEYDGAGRLVHETRPLGATFDYKYDARGLLIERTRRAKDNSVHGLRRWDYNCFGDLTRETDEHGLFVRYVRDGFGRTVEQHNPDSTTEYFTLDAAGRILVHETRVGALVLARTTQEFDASDRVTLTSVLNQSINPDGSTSALTTGTEVVRQGWAAGRNELLWTLADPSGIADLRRFEYDGLGRQTGSLVGSSGTIRTTLTLDAEGRTLERLERHDGLGSPGPLSPSETLWRYGYDRHGRLRVTIDPLGEVAQSFASVFDSDWLTVDPVGQRRESVYDSGGRLVRSVETPVTGTPRTTSYEYDESDNLRAHVDPSANRTEYRFDEFGRQDRRTFADLTQSSFVYTVGDRLKESHHPGGVAWIYDYDASGRLLSLQATGASANVTRTYGYDALSRINQITDTTTGRPAIVVQQTLSSLGRLLSERHQSGASPQTTFSMSYDARGLLKQVFYPSGMRANRLYTSAGQLSTIGTTASGLLATCNLPYGLHEARELVLLGGGKRVEEYDGLGRVKERWIRKPDGTTMAGASYGYSLAGNLETRVRAVDNRAESFVYDGFNRLKEWHVSAVGSTPARTATWAWDPADNPTAATDTLRSLSIQATPNQLNQITTYTPLISSLQYSSRGEESSRTASSHTLLRDWDALGRALSGQYWNGTSVQVNWTYDGLDRLVERSDTLGNATSYDSIGRSVHRIVDSTNGATEYVQGPAGDEPFYRYVNGSNGAYVHTDPLRNVGEIHTSTQMLSAFDYDPFGLPRDRLTGGVIDSTSTTSLFFASSPFDPKMSMSSMGPRLYDPIVARFISRDPLGEAAGPNLYVYSGQNPFRWWDPTGLGKEQNPGLVGTGGPAKAFDIRKDYHYDSVSFTEWTEQALEAWKTMTGYNLGIEERFEDLESAVQLEVVTWAREQLDQDPWISDADGYPGLVSDLQALQSEIEFNLRQADAAQSLVKSIVSAGGDCDFVAGQLSEPLARGIMGLFGLSYDDDASGGTSNTSLNAAKAFRSASRVGETMGAIGETGKVGEAELTKLGGKPKPYFRTSDGPRFPDQVTPDGALHEAKTGRAYLTNANKRQVLKDAELKGITKSESIWHFFRSPKTGKIGPSKPLADFLEKHGIKWLLGLK